MNRNLFRNYYIFGCYSTSLAIAIHNNSLKEPKWYGSEVLFVLFSPISLPCYTLYQVYDKEFKD